MTLTHVMSNNVTSTLKMWPTLNDNTAIPSADKNLSTISTDFPFRSEQRTFHYIKPHAYAEFLNGGCFMGQTPTTKTKHRVYHQRSSLLISPPHFLIQIQTVFQGIQVITCYCWHEKFFTSMGFKPPNPLRTPRHQTDLTPHLNRLIRSDE